MERIESFLGLSVALTGFSRLELLGTGMATEYLCVLDATLPAGVCDQLLDVWDAQSAGSDPEATAGQILADPKFGPVAQRLSLLWYRGAWTQLPADWRSAYGAAPLDVSRVVSAEAFQAGLQWIAAGGHAPGSRQQGFAAWSMPPEGGSL